MSLLICWLRLVGGGLACIGCQNPGLCDARKTEASAAELPKPGPIPARPAGPNNAPGPGPGLAGPASDNARGISPTSASTPPSVAHPEQRLFTFWPVVGPQQASIAVMVALVVGPAPAHDPGPALTPTPAS